MRVAVLDGVVRSRSDRAPDGTGDTGAPVPTIGSYIEAFGPAPSWTELCRWPPDVFAICNLLLDHTEAYRFAVAPLSGRRWPPSEDWEEEVLAAAEEWRESAVEPGGRVPSQVAKHWGVLVGGRDLALASLRRGEDCQMCETLLTLHAMADQTCRWLASASPPPADDAFERTAWDLLADHGSLSHIDSTRVRVTPKTHFAARGLTIRSFSRYLALAYESIEVHWRRLRQVKGGGLRRRDYNLVLAPWPLDIEAEAFVPTEGPLENMDRTAFGFFQFAPRAPVDTGLLAGLVEAARGEVDRVDAVILPEAAVGSPEVASIESLMEELGVFSLVAGVREPAREDGLGRNYVLLCVRTDRGWERYEQAKHHRWCLDESQIRQYHLCRALAPSRNWWEAIDIPPRTVEIIDVGGGGITVPLVCEDLARMDEVADLLRRIGPSLVLALLLDGPQLPQRWPCRYASVLADEPGSAVLTLSSLGMVTRSRPAGSKRSRVVAMWNDPTSGLCQIELARGASGILITASVEPTTVWTADGRRHERSTPSLTLTGVHQLRVPSPSRVETLPA
jgi:hypothetical protein